MTILQVLLFPLAVLYDLITSIRNWAYTRNLRGSVEFEANVISIGNLEVGGTGKTPMADFLIKQLSPLHQTALISRGYMRKSTGFRILSDKDNAFTAGDEPYQLYLKHSASCIIAVSGERETAIPFILAEHPNTSVFLLDDAFQYRAVQPSLNIVLTRYQRPFYEDYVLPAGRLRENRSNIQRADIIVVTKCPGDLSSGKLSQVENKIRNYTDCPVFFTTIEYGEPVPLNGNAFPTKTILISGIANAEKFSEYCENKFDVIEHIDHRDHYPYSVEYFEKLREKHGKSLDNGDVGILVTEKDAAKWLHEDLKEQWKQWSVFYLPIQVRFLKEESQFMKLVENSIKEYPLE